MIKRFVFGKAFDTEAVKDKPEACKEKFHILKTQKLPVFHLRWILAILFTVLVKMCAE